MGLEEMSQSYHSFVRMAIAGEKKKQRYFIFVKEGLCIYIPQTHSPGISFICYASRKKECTSNKNLNSLMETS